LGLAELGRHTRRPSRAWRPPAGGPGTSGRPSAPGTFGVRILASARSPGPSAARCERTRDWADLWVEGEIGRVTVSSAGHAYFALKDERNQLQCVWFRDQRIGRVRGPGRAAGRRSRPHRPVRAARRAPAVRRIDPAGGTRRPDPPLRGAEGTTGRRRALRRCPEAPVAGAPGDDRGHHQPDRRRLEGHLPTSWHAAGR